MQKFGRLKVLALIAVVFGAMTIFSGGRALFGDEQARAAVGNAVPFVLWFNFLAGFAYVLTGFGLWNRLYWAKAASIAIAGCTALIGVAFIAVVLQGSAYESRTAVALVLRLSFWGATAFLTREALSSSRYPSGLHPVRSKIP